MKSSKVSLLLSAALILSGALTGCRNPKYGVTPLGERGSVAGNQNQGQQLPEGGMVRPGEPVASEPGFGGGEAATFDPDAMNQDRAALAQQTVLFAFDSAAIRPSEQAKIDAVAAALTSDPTAKLLIEGNADERGTEEYNRSLGERRALAAREALATRGIDPNRIATRSYGEDRPADPGHNDTAWSKNRRDEFVLLHAR